MVALVRSFWFAEGLLPLWTPSGSFSSLSGESSICGGSYALEVTSLFNRYELFFFLTLLEALLIPLRTELVLPDLADCLESRPVLYGSYLA